MTNALKTETVETTKPAKLRWTLTNDGDERGQKGGTEQTATLGDRTYTIAKDGDGWKATLKVGKKAAVTLSEGSFAKAYQACVQSSREA